MSSSWLRSLGKYWSDLNIPKDVEHIRERRKRERQILRLLDNVGFSWRVYFVAASGFLASSWSLISTNIVSPALYFIYPPHGRIHGDIGLGMDEVTLAGTILGMIIFGHLADRVGRQGLYGYELLIILCAMGGVAFSSEGYMMPNQSGDGVSSSMNIYASIFWWRFVLGFGIGAEYPMSAIIAAEFASTQHRGTMIASVFFAQSVGRLLAFGIGYGALRGITREAGIDIDDPSEQAKVTVDILWRLVVGLAGVPAILAIGLRLTIPETARFYSAVKRDFKKARESAAGILSAAYGGRPFDEESLSSEPDSRHTQDTVPWRTKAWLYFMGESQGLRRLLAISLLWFLLDFAFYGTGLDNPTLLNILWVTSPLPEHDPSKKPPPGYGEWREDPANMNATILRTLSNNCKRNLELISISALLGGLAIIGLINFFDRRRLLIWTSAILAALFMITGTTVRLLYAQPGNYASMVFYSVAQFVFNLGPNTLIFVLAAEIFPTEFRGTCYGISAAAGKLGAMVVRPIIERAATGPTGLSNLLFIYMGIMALMTILAWVEPWGLVIPRVQVPSRQALERTGWRKLLPAPLENLTLEEIAMWPIDVHQPGHEHEHAGAASPSAVATPSVVSPDMAAFDHPPGEEDIQMQHLR